MDRLTKLSVIADLRQHFPDTPCVFTTGYISRIAHAEPRPLDFYMVGSMGLAASIGVGMSVEAQRLVVVVDGDGSLAMNLNSLCLAADFGDVVRLVHVVLDDQCYDSTGGQDVPPSTGTLTRLAKAAGYRSVVSVKTREEMGRVLKLVQKERSVVGAVMIHAEVERASNVHNRVSEPLNGILQRVNFGLQGIRASNAPPEHPR